MGLVPAGAWVSRPPVWGLVAIYGRCPLLRQHHGPSIPTMPLVRPPVPCVSRYLGRCPPRRETLGLMAWKCCSPFSTMTLRAARPYERGFACRVSCWRGPDSRRASTRSMKQNEQEIESDYCGCTTTLSQRCARPSLGPSWTRWHSWSAGCPWSCPGDSGQTKIWEIQKKQKITENL